MTCDEEFGLFLAARPEYTAYGNELPNPANDNRTFLCSNGEERQYYVPIVIPDCDEAFAAFLADNPQFMEGSAPVGGISDGRVERYNCPVTAEPRWYGYTVDANYERFLARVRNDPQESGFSDVGRQYFEFRRSPGQTIDEYYQEQAIAQYYAVRMFAADGSYNVVFVDGGRFLLALGSVYFVV